MALALAAFAPKWLEKISAPFLKSRLHIMGLIPILAIAWQRSSAVSFAVETSYPIYYFPIPIILPFVSYLYENDWSAIAIVSISPLASLPGPLAVYYAFKKIRP